ncbi:unnamed protein product [Brachionus calyciflorus]|uniref:ATP-dependent DNA helicase n=1 Tax=Brachionus calyciflorus TaxID=104777 RepID=A0A814NPP2_9BILA|nr:unnamed protein product [Brachionus calyciflorus]
MRELAATEMPYRLRFLFVTILVHNNPVNPNGLALWDNFQEAMSEDYREDDADTRIQKALGHLRYLLNGHGRTLADFNLPEPDERGLNWRHIAIPVNFEDMNPEQHRTIAMQLEATLNEQQRNVVETKVEAVLSNDPTTNKSYFVDGPGGTGKTYVINLLYHRLRQLNYRMIPTAFTGIAAALLIGGGQTLHSKFRIPIPTDLNSVSRIQADSEQAQMLRECKLFIIDEASQVSRAMLECIDRLL